MSKNLNIDLSINPWLENIDTLENEHYLNNILFLGYIVKQNIGVYEKNNSIDNKLKDIFKSNKDDFKKHSEHTHSIIESVKDQINSISINIRNDNNRNNELIIENCTNIQHTINDILCKTNKPVYKGQIGETFVENTLKTAYNNSIVLNTAQSPHESDIKFQLENYPPILIESKNYNNIIPSKEISKFKNDLDNTDISYGIFISFTQKITGIFKKTYMEQYKSKIILYVSCAEFTPSDIIYPIEIIINTINYQKSNNYNINICDLNTKSDKILNITNDLDILYTEQCNSIQNILLQRNIINKALDNIHSNALEKQIICKNIINSIRERISDELCLSVTNDNTNILPIDFNKEELDDKIKKIFVLLSDSLPDNFYIFKNQSIYYLCKDSNNIGKFLVYKNNID